MADNVIKLRVDSQEYESKIKRASDGLQALGRSLHDAGKTFADADAKAVEFAGELGKMQTVSNTAKGKIGEMSTAFVNLKTMYLQMTDAEKQSPLGQAMSKSLEELKTRTIDAKQELADINKELNVTGKESTETGGFLGQLSDKFTLNVDAIKLFNMGLTATKAALDVAKDAFFASETNVDDWGRTVAASEGIYDSFLQTLNTGDFSGFLSRIGEVISKAHDAYNALDELNTRMTIINPERTRLQARATELKAIIRRQGAGSEAGVAAQAELKQIEGMLSQAFKTESQLNMDAFKAKVDQKLADAGIKLSKKDYDFLMRTFSSDASFMAMKRGAKGSRGSDYVAGGSYDEGSTYKYDTRNMNQKLLDLFTDEWRQQNSSLLNAAFGARGAAASAMLGNSRYLKTGGSGGSGSGSGVGSDSIKTEQTELQKNQQTINTLTQEYVSISDNANEATRARQNEIQKEIQLLEKRNNLLKLYAQQAQGKLQGGDVSTADIGSTSFAGLPQIGEGLSEDTMKYIKNLNDGGKDVSKSWTLAASAMRSVGSAMSGLKNPAIDIMTVIGQSIASIALAYAENLAGDKTTKGNIWAFIAAAAAATVSMATTIASLHSATGYAEGGIVKGNSYSGDNVGGLVDGSQLVGLNAGEVVLTKAMQGSLANQLEGNGIGNLNLRGVLHGENIIISVDRTLRRMGRGELMTWKG